MGTVDLRLASDLRDRLGLRRAVETGTFRGVTARALAGRFQSVVTIELSVALHQRARVALSDLSHVSALCGHSAQVLGETVASVTTPTFYYLDGHWSSGVTDGAQDECPVLEEIAAIGAGHRDDCIVIDDARLFTAAPSPPLDPGQWPTMMEVLDAIRAHRPEHFLTLLDDQFIAVPARAKPVVDEYGRRLQETYGARLDAVATSMRGFALGKLISMRGRVVNRSPPRA